MASRYSIELALVARAQPGLQARDILADEIENAAVFVHALHARRRSVLSPSPKRRSNTARGLISIGLGVVGVRQETVLV